MNAAYSDPELLTWTLKLAKKFKLNTFFETGTYHGKTAKLVSRFFENVISVENNVDFYNIAKKELENNSNCKLYLGNSPDIMREILINGDNSIFFFLDAHWDDYWPLLDELTVIKEKNIKPCIAIHDFYVPDENGNPKFGYDKYKNQPLNLEYVESSLKNIYGDEYRIVYSETSTNDSGVIYIFPVL